MENKNKEKRVKIETTNTIHGCLEQGGVCGRVVSCPASVIAEIMECSIANAMMCNGRERVPGTSATLYQYLEHNGITGKVIRRGTVIK